MSMLLESLIARPLAGLVPEVAPAAQLVVSAGARRVIDAWAGESDDNDGVTVSGTTPFDLASVTKLFTAVAMLRLVEGGVVHLDDHAAAVLPGLGGGSPWGRATTWRQLLSHTAGLPATVLLQDEADPARVRARVLATAFERAPGTRIVYSDVGFMLIGFGIEGLTRLPIDVAIERLVIDPLGLTDTSFHVTPPTSAAPTEVCPWRGRRLRGEVHDENAFTLGGVAGHAGLFGTARDVARLGRCLLEGGWPILGEATVREMIAEQARDGDIRRGLGVSLWSPDPEATSNPLGPRAFGHTGFTGTSLWVDPDLEVVIALLTNAIYRGREDRGFAGARIALHQRLVGALREDAHLNGAA